MSRDFERGFTLLEAVFALVVVGLLAGAISSGLALTVKSSAATAEAAREVPQQMAAVAVIYKVLKEGGLDRFRVENGALLLKRNEREAIILKHVASFRTDCTVPATGLAGSPDVCRVELLTQSAGAHNYVFYAAPGTKVGE